MAMLSVSWQIDKPTTLISHEYINIILEHRQTNGLCLNEFTFCNTFFKCYGFIAFVAILVGVYIYLLV